MPFWPWISTNWEKMGLTGDRSSPLFTSLCPSVKAIPAWLWLRPNFTKNTSKDLTFTFNEEMAWSRLQRVAWHNLTKSWERELMTTWRSSKTFKYFWPLEHIFLFYIFDLAKSQQRELMTTCTSSKTWKYFWPPEHIFLFIFLIWQKVKRGSGGQLVKVK